MSADLVEAIGIIEGLLSSRDPAIAKVRAQAFVRRHVDPEADERLAKLGAFARQDDVALYRAAPALLAACEALLALSPGWPDDENNEHAQAEVHAERLDAVLIKARAAVAKARGDK